jgi:hypothetical protein
VIVVDTGPLVAAVLSNDGDHRACVDLSPPHTSIGNR